MEEKQFHMNKSIQLTSILCIVYFLLQLPKCVSTLNALEIEANPTLCIVVKDYFVVQ